MRIVQLISTSGFYGAEAMVVLLSQELRGLGCDVSLGIFNAGSPASADLVDAARKADVATWTLPCTGRFDVRAVLRLARSLREMKIDVLHTHGYKANFYGFMAARLAGCTAIATCHNWTDATRKLRQYGAFDRALLKRFDRVVAVSEGVSDDLRRSGVKGSRLEIVLNGVKMRPVSQASAPEDVTLGVLSRLSIEKGVDVLVCALPAILKEFPGLRCVVAGEGPERQRLLNHAAEIGVGEALELRGFCSDTAAFIATCSVMVHPSRIDGTPMAVLEAMAARKTIVASAVGGIPSMLRNGAAGLLVPPENPERLAEAVIQVLRNPSLAQRLAGEAVQEAQRYDARQMAQTYLALYVRHSGRGAARRAEAQPA